MPLLETVWGPVLASERSALQLHNVLLCPVLEHLVLRLWHSAVWCHAPCWAQCQGKFPEIPHSFEGVRCRGLWEVYTAGLESQRGLEWCQPDAMVQVPCSLVLGAPPGVHGWYMSQWRPAPAMPLPLLRHQRLGWCRGLQDTGEAREWLGADAPQPVRYGSPVLDPTSVPDEEPPLSG